MKKFLLIGFLGLSLAQAGDIAHFDLIGFSSNGKYLAFGQAAIGNGTGFPYADGTKTDCDGHAPQLSKLRLTGKATRVLQNDTRLPVSRRCASDYRMHSVFVYGSSMVVFVSVSSDGFEGSNIKFMAVTAKL